MPKDTIYEESYLFFKNIINNKHYIINRKYFNNNVYFYNIINSNNYFSFYILNLKFKIKNIYSIIFIIFINLFFNIHIFYYCFRIFQQEEYYIYQ